MIAQRTAASYHGDMDAPPKRGRGRPPGSKQVDNAFGRRLAERRVALAITQEELARRMGVSRTAYHSWESGTFEPGLDRIRALARELGVTPCWLAFGEDHVSKRIY